jgi:CRP/FNR family transcriptional regulator
LEKTEQLVYGSATGKIAYILLMLMQRHGKKEDGVWKIAVPFTHKDLGSLMGSTRETVSIEMQKLIKNGVITHEQQLLTIHDVAFLKNASQME